MRFLHTMIRVLDLDQSLDFFCNKLGLIEARRIDNEAGRFTLVYLYAPLDSAQAKALHAPEIELTFNWDPEIYSGGRNFGHIAFEVDNIYETYDTAHVTYYPKLMSVEEFEREYDKVCRAIYSPFRIAQRGLRALSRYPLQRVPAKAFGSFSTDYGYRRTFSWRHAASL